MHGPLHTKIFLAKLEKENHEFNFLKSKVYVSNAIFHQVQVFSVFLLLQRILWNQKFLQIHN